MATESMIETVVLIGMIFVVAGAFGIYYWRR